MDGCHQQCRRDSLATDVANSQNQSVRIHGEEIVIIATDRARGAAKPMHFERRQLRNVLREKHRLHFLRDGQLILQSLLRFLLLDQVLDRSSHRIERVGKRGELITRLDRNAMAEIPAIDVLRSEEHTSELQSRLHLVCRLLLEKKKKNNTRMIT